MNRFEELLTALINGEDIGDWVPLSRLEEYLVRCCKREKADDIIPLTRTEVLLRQLATTIAEGGGGGGTEEITDLTGTTWYFNDILNDTPLQTKNVNFATGKNPEEATYGSISYIGGQLSAYSYPMSGTAVFWSSWYPVWVNESNRTITFIDGDDIKNPDLISWLQTNATQVEEEIVIEDLTGMVISLKEDISLEGLTPYKNYKINFFGGGSECIGLYIDSSGALYQKFNESTQNSIYDNSTKKWGSNNYRVLYIIDGEDVKNIELINWVKTNMINPKDTLRLITEDVLGELQIPEGTTMIGTLFNNNDVISKILIPKTVKRISDSAFWNCGNLAEVLFEEGSTLTTIGNNVFSSNEFKSITFPASVETIGSRAISGCKKLKNIKMLSITPPVIGSNCFNDNPNLEFIEVPYEGLSQYLSATNWSAYADIIEPDTGILSLPNMTLVANLEALKSKTVNIPYKAENPIFSATSDDTGVCTVSVNNNTLTVVAVHEGTTSITVMMVEDNHQFTQTFTVNVLADIPEYTYSIEQVEDVEYGFTLNENGYYESTNKDIPNSYSLCKLNIDSNGLQELYLDCINSGESSYDFGLISKIDTALSLSSGADSNVSYSFKGKSSLDIQTINLGVIDMGEHSIYIKYIKDGSGDDGNDSLQFRVRIV